MFHNQEHNVLGRAETVGIYLMALLTGLFLVLAKANANGGISDGGGNAVVCFDPSRKYFFC